MPQAFSVREMELIWAVLQHGTMARAAAALNISQPAISRTVRHAQDRSGLKLFERRGTRLVPTRDLLELRPDFQHVFVSIERARTTATALRQGLGRPVRISSMSMLSAAFLPKAIAAMRQAAPNRQITIRINDRVGVEQDIKSEVSDIGLVHGLTDPATVKAMSLCQGTVVCLLPSDHPLTALPTISPRDLDGIGLVSLGRYSPVSRQVSAAFEREGLERRIFVQIADSRLGAQMAVEGRSVALLDPFFIGSVPLGDMVVRPFQPVVTATCYAIHNRDRALLPLEEMMLEHLRLSATFWQAGYDAVVPAG